jgi:serine/threonine-protein kinase
MILSAYALALARQLTFEQDDSVSREAGTAVARALSLARDRPEPHLASALLELQRNDNIACARAVRVAMAIAPHHADVHDVLGILTLEVNSPPAGIAHLYTAMTLDPTLMHCRWWIARAYALLGEWARCDALFENPPTDEQECNGYWMSRARSLLYRRTPEREARFDAEFAAAPAFDLRPTIAMALAWVRSPVRSGAASLLSVMGRSVRHQGHIACLLAELAAAANLPAEETMKALRAADAAEIIDVVWLDLCPLFADLRDTPDFRAIRTSLAVRAALVAEVLATGDVVTDDRRH